MAPNDTKRCYTLASQWLGKHVPSGKLIYTTDWDDFPYLYIQAPKLRYIVGLDPLFMAEKNRGLYWQWVETTQAQGDSPLAERIYKLFGASYIFVDTDHMEFMERVEHEGQIYRMFQCDTNRIYRIKEQIVSTKKP